MKLNPHRFHTSLDTNQILSHGESDVETNRKKLEIKSIVKRLVRADIGGLFDDTNSSMKETTKLTFPTALLRGI